MTLSKKDSELINVAKSATSGATFIDCIHQADSDVAKEIIRNHAFDTLGEYKS